MVKRETAYIVNIRDILKAPYIRTNEEYEPNYVVVNGKNVSRVNIIATVVSNDNNDNVSRLTIDDGSSSITLMSFENREMFLNYSSGDTILVIGRVREYNGNKYIVPEILKRIKDMGWVEYRKKQLGKPKEIVEDVVVDNIVEDVIEEDIMDDVPQNKVLEAVQKLDKGDGADIDEVIKLINIDGAEKLIESMLREGDIFQIKPGRIKIL